MQIAIVMYPGMTALDAIGPYEVLRFLPDAELRFVNHEAGPVVTDSGVLVLGATHTLDETLKPDIVLVPGSEANTATAMADTRLLLWLQNVHETTTLTLSVCTGSLILAAAGLLDGHPATTHWIAQGQLKQFGTTSQPNDRIVRSGKIVTAAGVSAGIDLALTVVSEICGQRQAEIAQLLIEYDPQPPFRAGHPTQVSDDILRVAKKEMLKRAKNPRDMISIPLIVWKNAINGIRKRLLGLRASS